MVEKSYSCLAHLTSWWTNLEEVFIVGLCLLQLGHFSKTSDYKLQQGYKINVNFRILLYPLHWEIFLCNKELWYTVNIWKVVECPCRKVPFLFLIWVKDRVRVLSIENICLTDLRSPERSLHANLLHLLSF